MLINRRISRQEFFFVIVIVYVAPRRLPGKVESHGR